MSEPRDADGASVPFLALSISECFGTEAVSRQLAESLQRLLPGATFLRVSLRCGSGLVVSDDLLRPGTSILSVVSLKHSLSGLAMRDNRTVAVEIPFSRSPFPGTAPTRLVVCVPAGVHSPPGAHYKSIQVGTLLVGSSVGNCRELKDDLRAGMALLAKELGPALLAVGLPRVQHLTHLLELRDADAEYIGAEEDLQDLPLDVCRTHGGLAASFVQPLVSDSTENNGDGNLEKEKTDDGGHLAGPPLKNSTTGVKGAGFFRHGHTGDEPEPKKIGIMGFDTVYSVFNTVSTPEAVDAPQIFPKDVQGSFRKGGALTMMADDALQLKPLLQFRNTDLENAYVAFQAQIYWPTDAFVCGTYLLTSFSLLWASKQLEQPHIWAALVLVAAMPFLVATTVGFKHPLWYARCREALLVVFLVTNAAAARRSGSSEASVAWASGVEHVSGYIGRSAGLVLSTVLPLGCRIRFCWLLPAHAIGLVTYGLLTATRDDGCSVALAIVSATLPLALVYCCELRARYLMVAAGMGLRR